MHIERLIQKGRDIDIDRFIELAKRQRIEKLFLALEESDSTSVVECLNGDVSYKHARLARVWLRRGEGMDATS